MKQIPRSSLSYFEIFKTQFVGDLRDLKHKPIRHTYTTRLLFTCLPSENYAKKGGSQQALMEYLVKDCNQLYTEGIKVRGVSNRSIKKDPTSIGVDCLSVCMCMCIDQAYLQVNWQGQTLEFYFKFLGAKGDWPWVRSCYQLKTGYTSKRKCHACPSESAPESKLHQFLETVKSYRDEKCPCTRVGICMHAYNLQVLL